jgi:hypothetical protein
MAKKKMTRDVPLPSSDGMFGGIKGRSLKAATPGSQQLLLKLFVIWMITLISKGQKVLADRTGRAMGDFPNDDYAMKFLQVGGILVVADLKMT